MTFKNCQCDLKPKNNKTKISLFDHENDRSETIKILTILLSSASLKELFGDISSFPIER
jgi:hypothetical protein